MNSLIVKPRKLKHETYLIFLSLIFENSGLSSFVVTFLIDGKNHEFSHFISKRQFVILNQSAIFSNSELICAETWLPSLWALWVRELDGLVRVVSSYKMKFSLSLIICIYSTIYIYTYVSISLVGEHMSWYLRNCCHCVKYSKIVKRSV